MRRLQLSKEAAQKLRTLASARLGGHGVGECERMAEALIHAAWLEYDEAIQL